MTQVTHSHLVILCYNNIRYQIWMLGSRGGWGAPDGMVLIYIIISFIGASPVAALIEDNIVVVLILYTDFCYCAFD